MTLYLWLSVVILTICAWLATGRNVGLWIVPGVMHLLVPGVRHMRGLPVVALAALLLAGQVEAAEQWTVWSVQNDGTAVRVGREVVAGQMVHHDGTETECWIMAGEFQKSHWFVVADINKARAQRGEPSIKPRVTYECRRAR